MRPIAWYKTLHNAKDRKKEGFFLVEGKRAIDQIARIAPEKCDEILVVDDSCRFPKSIVCPIRKVTEKQITTISSVKTPQGIIAVVRIPDRIYTAQVPDIPGIRIVLLEHVQDPGNIGSLIRSAAALGYDGVILSDQCADPLSPKVVQATSGALFSVWLRRTSQYILMLQSLKAMEFKVVGTDVRGKPINSFCNYSRHIIALGNEGSGLSDEVRIWADTWFRIPIEDKRAESLNVAAAGAICMFLGKNQGLNSD